MHLRIADRKKDLIKTSGGKYVAPQKIEALLKTKPILSEAVVIGDSRQGYCVLLVTVDKEEARRWSRRTGNPADINSEGGRRRSRATSTATSTRSLASFESVKYFRVAPRSSRSTTACSTASFKVKRKEVSKRYKALIDAMYPPGKD